jgi:hypothetical protein
MYSSYNWNKFALYIKRAELNQDEDYIKNALENFNNIGIVKNVSFISKTNEKGNKYNGVIVNFEKVFLEVDLFQLVEQFETNDDKTGKIYHNDFRYWIVQEYIQHSASAPQQTEINNIDVTNNEELILEYNLLQKRCEKQERKMMEYEEQLMRKWFENIDLQLQVDKKDCVIEWRNKDIEEQKKYYEENIHETRFKTYHFEKLSNEYYNEMKCLEEELTNKKKVIEKMQQDFEIVYNMLGYYEQKYGNYIETQETVMC